MSVHQLRITLEGVDPPVWRRLHVPSEVTLAQLHEAIQVVMASWEGDHLHSFTAGWEEYGGNGGESESGVTLETVLPKPGGMMLYLYDFGDQWRHVVEVEKVHQAAPRVTYPRCTAGRRACPPEDCGGPLGYVGMLKALRARKGWRYDEGEHLGRRKWDAAVFDREQVNAELARLEFAVTKGPPRPHQPRRPPDTATPTPEVSRKRVRDHRCPTTLTGPFPTLLA